MTWIWTLHRAHNKSKSPVEEDNILARTNFAYKAYMDVLLNFSEDAERSQMQTQLFYKDSAGAFDQTKINEVPLNPGLILRQKLVKK